MQNKMRHTSDGERKKRKPGEREKGERGRDYISRGIHEVEYQVGAREHSDLSPKRFPFS